MYPLVCICVRACANTFMHFWAAPHKPPTPTSSYLGPEPGMGPGRDLDLPHRPPNLACLRLVPGQQKNVSPRFLVELCPCGGVVLPLWFTVQLPRIEAN